MSDSTPKRAPLRIPFDRKNTILLTSLVHANPKQRRAYFSTVILNLSIVFVKLF